MADKKLLQLGEANPLDGTEALYVIQNGNDVKSTIGDIKHFIGVIGNAGTIPDFAIVSGGTSSSLFGPVLSGGSSINNSTNIISGGGSLHG